METILIVEDEKDILDALQYNLKKEGFHVLASPNGAEGLKLAQEKIPSLIILDLMLPGKDGLEICKTLKGETRTRDIPILILTAKSEEMDRVVGLEVGADDYVTKPFSVRELLARVRGILRRTKGGAKSGARGGADGEKILTFPGLTLDPEKREVLVSAKSVELSAKEFDLLYFLASSPGKVFSRERLLDDVWGVEVAIETRTVDVHVRRLRSKLGKVAERIVTVHGVGYKFAE